MERRPKGIFKDAATFIAVAALGMVGGFAWEREASLHGTDHSKAQRVMAPSPEMQRVVLQREILILPETETLKVYTDEMVRQIPLKPGQVSIGR